MTSQIRCRASGFEAVHAENPDAVDEPVDQVVGEGAALDGDTGSIQPRQRTPACPYNVDIILTGVHTWHVIVDWTDEFDRWFDHTEEQGGRLLTVAVALLQALTDLPAKPAEESATFKRVRQARRHELWRVAHPFDPEVAVRIICWFPTEDEVVIALIGFDKKQIGDAFYASAAARGEAMVDAWLRQKKEVSDDRGR